jgi:hypothetical protein
VAVNGAHGDDTRIGRRIGGLVSVLAVVTGWRDQDRAFPERVVHRRLLRGAASGGRAEAAGRGTVGRETGGVERQADHLGAVCGGVPDTRRDRGGQALHSSRVPVQRVGGVKYDPDGQDPGGGRDADDPCCASYVVPVPGDDAGGGRSLDAPGRGFGCLTRSGEIRAGDHGPR